MQVVDDLDQELARANALPYGLAGDDFAAYLAFDRYVLEEFAVGVIGINPWSSLFPKRAEGSIYGLRPVREKYVGHLEI
ncbi:hypothetical protein DBIPINDM_007228 (plasmid) [Mesorhizobium sp. AR02]|uniref:hypothetical protein n=1 Tax=Mesorhizobium sp. AR02 TaxID=2865837 RepID=UPI00215FCD39|nr:hypothetical protein [Mesorhizobium sp. AR02]UVK49985.1 hypothetical protein DBIPINDM_007228 [Mesorhizobium sp. AR02]